MDLHLLKTSLFFTGKEHIFILKLLCHVNPPIVLRNTNIYYLSVTVTWGPIDLITYNF